MVVFGLSVRVVEAGMVELEECDYASAAGYFHRGGRLFRTMGSAMVISCRADCMDYSIISPRTLVP